MLDQQKGASLQGSGRMTQTAKNFTLSSGEGPAQKSEKDTEPLQGFGDYEQHTDDKKVEG